ncbi:Galactinol--sucrose galactosyltransferase [Spatholobus suberectus]|nr:Galactinol--sucrose galactosyltransferase [Spatholobus suberectus]
MAPSLSEAAELDALGLVDRNSPLSITLEGSNFLPNGHPFLTKVPANIIASKPIDATTTTAVGCFVGFDADEPRSRHVAPMGKLRGIRFMSIFRFKVWWTTHWVGSNGREVEHETQMILLDKNDSLGRPYVLLLPSLPPTRVGRLRGRLRGERFDTCQWLQLQELLEHPSWR